MRFIGLIARPTRLSTAPIARLAAGPTDPGVRHILGRRPHFAH